MSHMTNPSHAPSIQNALNTLAASEREWLTLGEGQHSSDLVQAHALRTQCLTQAAVVHVLLDIAESLRKIADRSSSGE